MRRTQLLVVIRALIGMYNGVRSRARSYCFRYTGSGSHSRCCAAAAVVGLLYVPLLNHGRIPTGSLDTYVQNFRFNGPVFPALALVKPPQLLAGLAVLAGSGTATWLRCAVPERSPDTFAWDAFALPMTASLLCAPAVFPWYLLWLLPFLMSALTLLITIWTVSIIPTYIM